MPKATFIDDVDEAVAAVKAMQRQIAGLVEALKLVVRRIEAMEKKAPARGSSV